MRLSKTIWGIFAAVTVVFGLTGAPDAQGQVATSPSVPPLDGIPTVTADHLLTQGVSAERQGDLNVAEECYRQLLQTTGNAESDQTRILPLHRLAVLNAKRKKFEESEQFFQQAVRLDGNNISLLSDFAQLQFDRKQYRDAEIILKYAFLLEPENTRILYNLGYSVALQQDRQTEGLRYLKLALGETRALRELATIYRILGENEQAEFAEQRAAQQEQRFKSTGRTPEPPSLEARKELYEQIKRELIRAKSLEFAQELEKAGIRHIEMLDSEERTKSVTTVPPTTTETPPVADTPVKILPAPVPSADPFLAHVEPAPIAPSDPWTVTSPQAKALPSTAPAPNAAALKPLPETEGLRSSPTLPELADKRTRISNAPTAVPLPPIDEQGGRGNGVLRTPPTLAEAAAPTQYPQYAEIGAKSQTPRTASNPLLPTPQDAAGRTERLVNTTLPKPSRSPSFFDLVQPVNLVALDAHRERETFAPTAPIPEKIDEIAIQTLPMVAPEPETLTADETLPSSNAVRQIPIAPFSSVAPSPESIASRPPTESLPKGKQHEPVAVPKVWKEIAVEPYIYVDNVKPPKELRVESKTPSDLSDPWMTQRPDSGLFTDFHSGNKLREKEENNKPKPNAAPEPVSTAKVEPKPNAAPEPSSTAKVEPKPNAALEPSSTAKVELKPELVRIQSDPFLQRSVVEWKKEPLHNQGRKEEIVKQIPVPIPTTPEIAPLPKQGIIERPAPILEPPVVFAPSPPVVEPKNAERQPVLPTTPPPAVAWKQPDRTEFVRPVPSVSIPEPPQPKQDEPVGFAQTPPSSVRIVNIIDTEPPPENQPGFARSGKYAQ